MTLLLLDMMKRLMSIEFVPSSSFLSLCLTLFMSFFFPLKMTKLYEFSLCFVGFFAIPFLPSHETQTKLLLFSHSFITQDWCSSAPQLAVYASRFPGLNSVQSEYSLSSAGHSVYSAGAAWMPHFFKVKEGFSVNVMKPRGDIKVC